MAERRSTAKANAPMSSPSPPSIIIHEARPFTWADPGTWPASLKFLPAYVALVAVLISVYWNRFVDTGLDLTSYPGCIASFNYTFRINAALHHAQEWSTRSWEIGYAHEATQQIFNPERTVFGPDPFPQGKMQKLDMRLDQASSFVKERFNLDGKSLLDEEDGAVSDPAAMGIAALQFAQSWVNKHHLSAVTRQKDILLNEAPKWSNGAISHRYEQAELWSDAVAMFGPFLSYYGVANSDTEVIREAVRQIGLYRDVLVIKSGPKKGLWKHVIGPSSNADAGAWSTGNAWALYGITRVYATLKAWPTSRMALSLEAHQLTIWIKEILDAMIKTDDDSSGLLRSYLGDSTWAGETSGTSLAAATVYRMAVLDPEIFADSKYLDWAHLKRKAVVERVDSNGIAKPAVNPLKHNSKDYVEGSAEGQSFLLLLGTAWRDCVCSGPTGICLATYVEETQAKIVGDISFSDLMAPYYWAFDVIKTPFQRIFTYFNAP